MIFLRLFLFSASLFYLDGTVIQPVHLLFFWISVASIYWLISYRRASLVPLIFLMIFIYTLLHNFIFGFNKLSDFDVSLSCFFLFGFTFIARFKCYDRILVNARFFICLFIIIQFIFILANGLCFACRYSGSFNNPNQLGYAALIFSVIAYILFLSALISRNSFLFFTIFCLILAFFSGSKGSVFSMIILISIFSLSPISWKSFSFLISIIFVGYLLNNGFDSIFDRYINFSTEADTSFEARGLIFDYEFSLTELLFGLGVKKMDFLLGIEVHSTPFLLFYYYGFVGLLFFLIPHFIILGNLFNKFGLSPMLTVFLPLAFYSLTHVGFRFYLYHLLIFVLIVCSRPAILRGAGGR